jgi:acyl-CoA-binding protein
LYGLHKQISFGDCTIEEPRKFYFISWNKYKAWKKYEGMEQEKAEELFIKNAKEFLIKWD